MLQEQFDTKKLIEGIKGHVKVELFNANTGKLEEKVESNNFIALAAVRHLQWYQRRYYFKDQISTLNSNLDQDFQPVDAYDAIVLSDSTANESSSTEWFMPGNLVGFSLKSTYVGADIYRGSPNATQSEATPTYTKWVFDWPTNAGNGTIGSIGWMKYVAYVPTSTNSLFISNASLVQIYTSSIPYHQVFARVGSNTYMAGNNVTIYNLDANFQQTSSFSVSSQFSSSYGITGITWDSTNSKVWVIGRSAASTWKLASYNASGTLIDGPFTLTGSRTYQGLAYDGTNLYSLELGNNIIYKINTNGTDASSFTYIRGNSYYWSSTYYEYSNSIAYDTSSQKLIIGTGYNRGSLADGMGLLYNYGLTGKFFTIDTNGTNQSIGASSVIWPHNSNNVANDQYRYDAYQVGLTSSYTWQPDFDIDTNGDLLIPQKISTSNTTNGYILRVRMDGLGSRTKLPATVTKTNTQTMKITYQMNFS